METDIKTNMEDLSDKTTIELIKDKGLSYFEECDAAQLINKNFFKSFVLELGELFFDKAGCSIFIDYVLDNKESTIWRRFRPKLGGGFIDTFVEDVLDYLEDHPIEDIIFVVEHIFYKPNDELYDEIDYPLMHNLFNSLEYRKEETEVLADFLWKDIGKDSRKFKHFVNYASELFNEHMYLINETIDEMEVELGVRALELAAVLETVLKLYCHASDFTKFEINLEYLMDESCDITWFSKTKDVEHNYQTVLFCLALHGIRVMYVPFLKKLQEWPISKKEIEAMIDKFEENPTVQWIFGIDIDELTDQCDRIDAIIEDLDMAQSIVSEARVKNVYDDLIKILLKMDNPSVCLDDMFDNMLDFFEQNAKPVNSETVNLLIKIVSGSKLTTSYYTIYKMIHLIIHHVELNEEHYMPFYSGLVNFVIKINKLDVEDLGKKITAYSSFITQDTDLLETYEKVFSESKYKTLRFIMVIAEDYHKIYEVINEHYNVGNYKGMGAMVLNLMYFNKLLFTLLQVKSFREHCKSKVVLTDILTLINIPILVSHIIITKLNDGVMDKEIYKFVKCAFNSIKLLKLHNLRDCSNFNIDVFDGILEKFMEKTVNKGLEFDILPILEAVDTDNDKTELEMEVPDEFLDPITYTPIDEPALLPDMDNVLGKTFVEKSTMVKSLLIKEENPFTRGKLTVEEFEKFNDDPKCKQEINQFKNKIGEWKRNNKI